VEFSIGSCTVQRRSDPMGLSYYVITCPTGRAEVHVDRVYIYGPWGARMYIDSALYKGVEGRVRAVRPAEESLAESFRELGLHVGAEEPHELYEALAEKEEEARAGPRRRWGRVRLPTFFF